MFSTMIICIHTFLLSQPDHIRLINMVSVEHLNCRNIISHDYFCSFALALDLDILSYKFKPWAITIDIE